MNRQLLYSWAYSLFPLSAKQEGKIKTFRNTTHWQYITVANRDQNVFAEPLLEVKAGFATISTVKHCKYSYILNIVRSVFIFILLPEPKIHDWRPEQRRSTFLHLFRNQNYYFHQRHITFSPSSGIRTVETPLGKLASKFYYHRLSHNLLVEELVNRQCSDPIHYLNCDLPFQTFVQSEYPYHGKTAIPLHNSIETQTDSNSNSF